MSYFLSQHTFSTFASSFLRGKRANPTHKQIDVPKANSLYLEKSNKNFFQHTFKTVDNYIKTVTDRNEKTNDCLTVPLQKSSFSGYINSSASNKLLWWPDSFVLLIPPLRQAPKRYCFSMFLKSAIISSELFPVMGPIFIKG